MGTETSLCLLVRSPLSLERLELVTAVVSGSLKFGGRRIYCRRRDLPSMLRDALRMSGDEGEILH
jgi:hypothetical protein